jgi:hypothetical protein
MQHWWPAPPQSSGPSQVTWKSPAQSAGAVHDWVVGDAWDTQHTSPELQTLRRHKTPA